MTTPVLSIDAGKHISRVYRYPDRPMPESVYTSEDGGLMMRHRDAVQALQNGVVVPSITNVLGVRNMPHLVGWSGKKAAEEAVRVAREFPGLLLEKPSEAVQYLKGAADRDRDMAAAQGDAVHNACEDIARGLPCPSLPSEQMKYVDSWKAFVDRWQPEFLALEATVFGETPEGLPYAGTGDTVFKVNDLTVLGDYKTTRSGIHVDVACQLSGIAHARHVSLDNETLSPMIPVQAGVAIHLSQDGYQVKPVQLGGQVWETFCAFRQAWDFHVLDGGLRDGSKAVNQTLSGPEKLVACKW